MRRPGNKDLLTWGGIGLVIVLALVVLWQTGSLQLNNPRVALATGTAPSPSSATPSPTATATPGPARPGATATVTRKVEPTAALPALPEVTPPPGGQVYVLTPAPDAAGWAANGDLKANHFGDYNIYAGAYDGQAHLGALQFDLSAVPPGAPIAYADLTLVGLSGEWLGEKGSWSVQMLQPWLDEGWEKRTYADLAAAPAAATGLEPALGSADLAAGEANTFRFGPEALAILAERALVGRVSFRVAGPAAGDDSLFAWDSGYGSGSGGWKPVLRVAAGPAPDHLPPTPTPAYVVVTGMPTPENIVTQAAMAATSTAQATTTGTPTSLPPNWVTPAVIVPTATPGNEATAAWQAAEAAARELLTGTPTPLPPNAWTATPGPTALVVIVTNTPTPANWATAIAGAEAEATRHAAGGPPTRMPPWVITATPRPGIQVVTATPTAENLATVEAARARATIVALTTGTYTPVPDRLVTATPLPLLVPVDRLTPTPTPEPTPRPQPMPAALRGKIVFKSDRLGGTQLFAMDPDGDDVYWLTQSYPYDQALAALALEPGGGRWVAVQPDNRGMPQVYLVDPGYDLVRAVTRLTGWAYDPAWAPGGETIAFVSTEAGNDEIYTIDLDGSGLQRLTWNTWEWDKHPAWSPDGRQLVFYSNRETGRTQIWIMNADGTAQRNVSNNPYNDWDPVWIP